MEENHDKEQEQNKKKGGGKATEQRPEQADSGRREQKAVAEEQEAARAQGGGDDPAGGPEDPSQRQHQWAGQYLPPGYMTDPATGQAVFTGNGGPAGGPEDPSQRQHQWAGQYLPPGYMIDPATGQMVFTGYAAPRSAYPGSFYPGQPIYYYQGETPEQLAARQAEAQQRHGQIMRSFEQFVEGDATVSDVVRTLYTNTAHNEQLWKGVLVGAAAAVLLTSKPARDALGKTLSSLFAGVEDKNKTPTDHEDSDQ